MKPDAYAKFYRYRLGYDIPARNRYWLTQPKPPKPKATAGTGGFKLKRKHK